jgi:nitrile hydratase accessory protein
LNQSDHLHLQGFLPDQHDSVFAEPWQAQAFAITVVLNQKGVFSWQEWAEVLAAEVRNNAHLDDDVHYYQLWLSALENLMVQKGLVSVAECQQRARAWHRAAMATPHGEPIELSRGSQGPETSPGTSKKASGSNL